jgi:phospholipase/carboxylesterase
MTVFLDGPRMPPARGGKADALVILLHGYGSNGADLISLAPYWAKALPGVSFVSRLTRLSPCRKRRGAISGFPSASSIPI